MVERVRCPHCSTVFPATATPRCPHCGLAGRVLPAASAPASASSARARPARSRRSRGRASDRVVAAVAVVVLLLTAGIITAVVLDGPDAPAPTADLDGAGAPEPGLGFLPDRVVNRSAAPPNVERLAPNSTVGGAGPGGPEPAVLSFDGAGDEETEAFTTVQGLLRVRLTYLGDGYFSATFVPLDDQNASRRPLFAPGQGDYEGTRYVGLEPGRYALDVRGAGGAWEVSVEQPRVDAPDAPRQWTGSGDDLEGDDRTFRAEGTVVFHAAHAADRGEFVVRLYDANGNLVRRGNSEAVVSLWGDESRSVAVALPAAGTYFVDVQAAGGWSVEVSY